MCGGRHAQPAWHVDSVNGSDGNAGRSPAVALRTIAAVAAKIRPGDTVALACGSKWRETLPVPADGVKVVAWGSGAKPLLDCSDIVTPTAGPFDAYVPTIAGVPSNAGLWSGWQASIAASGTAPDGSTAYHYSESVTGASENNINAPVSLSAGVYHFSVFLKAAERSCAFVGFWNSTDGTKKARFNLSDGTAGGADTGQSVVLTAYPNGWWRVDAALTVSTTAAQIVIGCLNADDINTNIDWLAVAGSGIYVWYPASAQPTGIWSRTWQPYTLPASLATWSTWLTTMGTDTTLAPDGVTLATKIKETANGSNSYSVYTPLTLGVGAYQFTCCLKAAERTWMYLSVRLNDGTPHRTWVNLATGVAGTVDASMTVTILALANGWYRCTVTATGTSMTEIGLCPAVADANISSTGVSGDGFYAWYDPANASTGNVYQATVPIDWCSGKTFVSAWENNVRMVRAASAADSNATAGSYFPSAENTTPITLYVHAGDGSNPGTNGKTYEYSKRQHAYIDGGPNCTTTGIWTRRNLHNDGSLEIAGRAVNCLASEGSLHNLYVGPGATLIGVECLDAYWPMGGSGTLAVYNANTAAGQNVTFENCWFHCSIYNPNMDGVYGHVNVSGAFGTISYLNCRVDNCSNGFGGGNAANVAISGGSSTGCRIAANPAGTAVAISNFTASAILYGVQTMSTVASATITGCSFTLTGGWACSGVYVGSSNSSIDLEQTAIAGTSVFGVYDQAAGTHFKARNNNITCDGYFWYLTDATVALDSDSNTFANLSGNKMNVGGTDYTLAAYKTATGQDAHSTP